MTTLTIQLPDDTALRLRALASARGISLDKLIEEVSAAALNAHEAEARFRAMAAKGDRKAALEVLAGLDRKEGC
jgi:predicted transcriptional regulator